MSKKAEAEAFVETLAERLDGGEFSALCLMAATGEMGFGRSGSDWGDAKTGAL